MNTETVYNSGKNKDGAVMKRFIDKYWWGIKFYLVIGIVCVLMPLIQWLIWHHIDARTWVVFSFGIVQLSIYGRKKREDIESNSNDN